MKNYVITMSQLLESVKAAERCIESGAKFNVIIKQWEATTPNELLPSLLFNAGIKEEGFKEKYSRIDNCMAAFHSHWSLWNHCVDIQEEITIFEHDAVIIDLLPVINFNGCINLGRPSYGKFNTPSMLSTNPLTSKRYFPGAHAYRVNPSGAQKLIDQAIVHARPTDVFLNMDTFPWLQEYYPWPVEARDTFTTIQKTEGCLAKHNYHGDYKIL